MSTQHTGSIGQHHLAATSAQRPADLVVHGGSILSYADWSPGRRPEASAALAVRDGMIVALGDDDAVAPLIGARTRVIDLAGRTVIPGINDTHLHLICYAMARFGLRDVSAERIGSWAGLAEVLVPAIVGSDGWIRAQGWDASSLGRMGSAADIDAALRANGIEDTPTVLFDRTGHQLLAGSAAMRRLGIDHSTPNPTGGVIERDASGAPTGVFTDAATAVVLRGLPPVPVETLRRVLEAAQRELAELGITSVTDPGIGPGHATLFDGSASPLALDALAALADADALTLRTSVLLTFGGTGGESIASVRTGLTGELPRRFDHCDPRMLRIAGVKIFADGIQRSGTAWHREPYGEHESRGSLAVAGSTESERTDMLRGILRTVGESGLQTGVHATGDAASDAVVEGLTALPDDARRARPYLIHGDFLPADGMPELAAAGIGWTANPVISRMVCGIGLRLLGRARQERRQPLRSALDAGVTVTLSSDAPVVSPDWREAIITAVERSQLDGRPRPDDPEQLDASDALAMMTVLAARLDGADAWKGRLAPGYAADLAVLSAPWPERVQELRGIGVDLTLVGGRIVYERGRS